LAEPPPFLADKRQALSEGLATEHRVRRDLLVDEDARTRFFDERVPDHVTTGKRFDRWWRDERERRPDLLTYRKADLVDPDAGQIDEAAYPEWLPLGAVHVPVTYTDAPGEDLDGVSVDVPVALLDQAPSLGLEWQVPGYRHELLTALVRSLPKEVRRGLGPVDQLTGSLVSEVGPEDGPFLEVLSRALSSRVGTNVRLGPAHLERVPDHLRVTYRAVDGRGRPLAWSKDLPALRRRMADRLAAAIAAAAPIDEATDLRSWTVGEVPRSVDVDYQGQVITAFPALVDEGDAVALRVLPTEREQRVAMWAGTRRLLLLGIGAPLRTLDRGLGNAAKLVLAASPHATAADVYRQCAEAAVDALLLDAGGPVWDEHAFETLLATVRSRFAATATGAARTATEILAVADEVDRLLAGMPSQALDDTVIDARAHLARLLRPGWIVTAGIDRLPDVHRYVRALEHRLARAPKDPRRDQARTVLLQDLERQYAAVAARDGDGAVRTLLEELRVATFAQPVGAKGGPSEQKARKALAALHA
jgi:ATP-dependent helicase HrpA